MQTATRSIVAAAVLWASLCSVGTAQDEIYLEITQPGLRRVAVAAPPLMVLPGTPGDVSVSFQSTLDKDLAAAAPIAVVDRRLYSLVEDDPRPDVLNQRWRSIGAQFLLSGTVVRAGGELVVEARLVDLVSGEFAFAKRYRAGVSAAQVVAHTLANDLVQVFTGRPGPFLSRMAFISDRSGSAELWVMDWNGSNPKQLTKHGSIALGPAWAPDGKKLIFTSYLRGTPALFELIPQEGYLKMLRDQGGVNSSADFSPDGSQVAFSSSEDGNVDIYVMPSGGGTPRRLTTARGIDTQPAWAPNGRQIAFTSTRAGSPQIYIMDSDGSNVRRLVLRGAVPRRGLVGAGRHPNRLHHEGQRKLPDRHHRHHHRGANRAVRTGQQRVAGILAGWFDARLLLRSHREAADLHHRRGRRPASAHNGRHQLLCCLDGKQSLEISSFDSARRLPEPPRWIGRRGSRRAESKNADRMGLGFLEWEIGSTAIAATRTTTGIAIETVNSSGRARPTNAGGPVSRERRGAAGSGCPPR